MKFDKPTQKKILIALLVLTIIGIIIWFVLDNKKKKLAAANAANSGATSAATMPAPESPSLLSQITEKLFSNCPNDSFPLKKGSCGKRVEQLQQYLIKQFGAKFSLYGVDGKWGDETDAIIRKYILKNDPYSISEEYFNKTGMGSLKTTIYP
jgi:hypothetical protein